MQSYYDAFTALVSDPRYLANIEWGTPRAGHPEGTLRAHITEIEINLERLRLRLREDQYWKLKLLIHAHDSLKPEAAPNVPIEHPKSHASLGRVFLASFCDDADLLAMLQYHDEPFALYRQFESKGQYDHTRFARMLSTIRDWDTFIVFNIIDGCTAGKSRDHLFWFFREIAGRVESGFTAADIIA